MLVRLSFVNGLMLSLALAVSASAQTESIAWHSSLEGAKAEARRTGRYVLAHFWTEDCVPCAALDRNVFSQPEVANAVQAQFVPVKLNANENPATASSLGVTRVPTDVILTSDGQVVGKLISPATPMAYVAEVSQVATKHANATQGMPTAIAAAPQPPQLNSVYASLPVSPLQPMLAQQTGTVPIRSATGGLPLQPPSDSRYGEITQDSQHASAAPHMVANQFAAATPGSPAAVTAKTPVGPAVSEPQLMMNQFAAMPGGPAQPSVSPAPQAQNNVVAAGAPAAGAPDPQRLPPGAAPLGFEGYCPVSMRNDWRWVAGNPQFGVGHRGRTYWFASAKEQQQFWANPDYYAPALSGMDPVLAMDHRQQVPGKREHSLDYDNLFYMFASEASLQQFTANPERYATGVREAMGLQRGRSVR
jgi:protein disulfide-isomerase